MAAKKLSLSEVPVHVAEGLTDAQIRAYRLMDNRSHEEAKWDFDVLGIELEALRGLGADMQLTGFTLSEIGHIVKPGTGAVDENAVAASDGAQVSKPGDLWLLGPHRVLCGDATKPDDVTRLLGTAKPHLMVTDPPYGVAYDAIWRDAVNLKPAQGKRGKVANDYRADWREAWALFPGDVAYVWHSSLHLSTVQASLDACGFAARSLIVWAKDQITFSRGHYHWQHESCWYAVRGTAHWCGDRKQSTVWRFASRDDSGHGHSTQKPVEAMRRPILNNSQPGEAVYDPFLGSGTTIIAAETTERICFGLELEPRYVDAIVRRWQDFSGKEAKREGDGKTFKKAESEAKKKK